MTQKNHKDVLFLGGDGIGPEVLNQALRMAKFFIQERGLALQITEGSYGESSFKATGKMITDEVIEHCLRADAVMFGSTGGEYTKTVPADVKKHGGLPALRKKMGVFANLRPVKPSPALLTASTLKPEVIQNVDMIIVRELTGGVYFGEPRGIKVISETEKIGFDTQIYTSEEIRRIARVAFSLARQRRNLVYSVDKSNVMESGKLWREVITEVHKQEFSDVKLEHMLADNCAMQIVRNPAQFDVLVTDNLFGDLLSDCAAMLTGSLGMLPSAAISTLDKAERRPALYEPVHGSAPDIAGTNKANPLAAILSFAMALRYSLDAAQEADMLEEAVAKTLMQGARTADVAQPGETIMTTSAMGDAVIANLQEIVRR